MNLRGGVKAEDMSTDGQGRAIRPGSLLSGDAYLRRLASPVHHNRRSTKKMFDNGKQAYRTDIKLGDRYRDDQTGIEGVATSLTFFQHACERVCLELLVKGELKEYVFDAPRVTHINSGRTATTEKTGGTRDINPQRGPARR